MKQKPKPRGCNLCYATMQKAKKGLLKEDMDCMVCLTSYKGKKK